MVLWRGTQGFLYTNKVFPFVHEQSGYVVDYDYLIYFLVLNT